MKYLINFRIFEAEEEIGTDNIKSLSDDTTLKSDTKSAISSSLADDQKSLAEFNQKKTMMENIFKDPKISDDAALASKLLTDVYASKKESALRNTWLTKFETVLRMERSKKAREEAINKDQDSVKSTNDDIYRLDRELKDASLKRKAQIVSMIEKNKKTLKELKDNINSNKRLLSQDTINWRKKHEDFKRDMKTEEERIKNLLSKK
jgi:hypothetical protein